MADTLTQIRKWTRILSGSGGEVSSTNPLPTTTAVSTVGPGKAEDVASADGDMGIPAMAVRKATPANTSNTDGDYEFIQMSAGRLWTSATVDALPSQGYSAAVTFTPAAASHVAGDANGAIGEFTSIGPSAARVMITSASLLINSATAEATAWRLYLFNVTPPSALADDGAFVLPSGDQASFLGYVDLGTAVDLVDSQWVETHGINKQIKLAGTSVFSYLVNLTTLTPAAAAHTATLHTVAV